MKITIIRRKCGMAMGGAEGYCANVSSRLKERGHNVVIVADESSVNGVPLVRARAFGRGSVLKNLSFFMESRQAIKKTSPSCVYGLSRIQGADFLRISDPLHAAWLELGYKGSVLAAILRQISLRHSLLLWQERQAIRTCRYLITNSALVKEQLFHYYKVKPEYVSVVYSGVDLQRFKPASGKLRRQVRKGLGIEEGETVLLFAGTDLRRKGLDCLFKAVSRLSTKVKVLVAGPERTKALETACQRLGIGQQVGWLGYRMDMERVYMAADLFCLPTFYDPFANAVLEAMACGTPVITTRLNGASEVVEEVAKGLVIERPDPAQLANAISRFLHMTSSQREEFRGKVAEHATHFSWDRHLDQLEDLFRSHCGRN